MNPTRLVYEAWKNTEEIIYKTSDGEGKSVAKKLVFLDPAEHPHIEPHVRLCVLCGDRMTEGIPRSKVFSDVFTDWPYCRNISGTHVCPACCLTILTNPNGRIAMRTYSWLATKKELKPLNRPDAREILLNPPEPPFLIVLAISQKKHLIFKGTVSYSREVFPIMLEETPVFIQRSEFAELLELVEHFMFGFTKTEIKTGEYNQQRVLKFGVDLWEWFEEQIAPYRGMSVLDVVDFVAQKVEKEEQFRCFLASKQKTTIEPQQHSLSMLFTEAGIKKEGPKGLICGGKSNDLPKCVQSEQLTLELF